MPPIESLEPRRLFAVSLVDQTLTITGTDGNDTIALAVAGVNYEITDNGATLFVPLAGVRQVVIDCGGGIDRVNIIDLKHTSHVNGGAGNDLIDLGFGTDDLSRINADVWWDGGDGIDQARLWDGAAPVENTYVYSAIFSEINRNGAFSRLCYERTEILAVTGSNGDNIFYMGKVDAGVQLNCFGSGGNDTLYAGGDGLYASVGAILGHISFAGGDGADAVVLNDVGTVEHHAYLVTGTSARRVGTGAVSYNVEALVVNGGDGNNTFVVDAAPATTTVTLNGRAGKDTFATAGGAGGNLNFIGAAITFNGGDGLDTATIYDAGAITARDYLIDNGAIAITTPGSTFGSIAFGSGVEDVVIHGGEGWQNAWHVAATPADTIVTIHAGAGDDNFILGADPGTLDHIAGALVINAGGGYDAITLADGADPSEQAFYHVGPTYLARDNFTLLTYGGAEQLWLHGGAGESHIRVAGTNLATSTLVLGGHGDDEIRIEGAGWNLDDVPGVLTVDGGAGDDDLIVADSNSNLPSGWTITPDMITRDRHAWDVDTVLVYDGFEFLDIYGGRDADQFDVNGTAPGTPVRITGGHADFDNIFVNETDPTAPVAIGHAGQIGPNVVVNMDGVGAARVTFDTAKRVNALSIRSGGHARLTATDGNGLLHIKGGHINITGDGVLDLGTNDLAINYAPGGGGGGGASPIGGWNGSAYTGVTGMIARGYNFGAWDGSGIITSAAQAATGVTTIAVAEAADVLYITGDETAWYGGDVLDATTVLVKYTYAGDANLDGAIDGADYGAIDNWVQFPGTTGFFNGDFNFDGVIDGADYGIIDNAVQFQEGPL